MARSNDAFGALAIAGIAVLVLVAWRTGALNRLLVPARDSADADATRFTHVADYLPNTAGSPSIGGGAAALATAARGVLDNGFSATSGVLATTAAYVSFPGAGNEAEREHRALTRAATLPNAVQRIAAAVPWWKRPAPVGTVETDYSGVYGEGGGNSALVLN